MSARLWLASLTEPREPRPASLFTLPAKRNFDIPDTVLFEAPSDAVQVKADELTNHVVSTIRDWFRAQRSPWGTMTFDDQRDLLRGIERLADEVIRDIVRVVAAEDRKVIVAKCEKVEFVEKGLKATFSASQTSEYRHELADSRGLDCLIVVADPGAFANEEHLEPDAPKSNQMDMLDERPVFDSSDNGQDYIAETQRRRR